MNVKQANPVLAQVLALVGAGVGALSSSKHDRGKGALIGAAAGAALGGGIGYYMDVQEAKLRDKMQGTGVSVTRNGDNIVLNMPNNVTFDSNSANLKPAGANTPTGVAMVLKEYEKTAVNVVGYTDSTGSKGSEYASVATACGQRRQRAHHPGRGGQSHSHHRHGPGKPDRQQQHGRKAKRRTVAWKSLSARCSKRIFISPGSRSAGQNA